MFNNILSRMIRLRRSSPPLPLRAIVEGRPPSPLDDCFLGGPVNLSTISPVRRNCAAPARLLTPPTDEYPVEGLSSLHGDTGKGQDNGQLFREGGDREMSLRRWKASTAVLLAVSALLGILAGCGPPGLPKSAPSLGAAGLISALCRPHAEDSPPLDTPDPDATIPACWATSPGRRRR